MRGLLFHFLPQVLDRIEVRRVGGQLFNRQAIFVRLEKRLHRLARVITGAILNHDQVLRRLRHDIEQKRRVALRVEAPRMGLVKKLPGEIVDQTKDLRGRFKIRRGLKSMT